MAARSFGDDTDQLHSNRVNGIMLKHSFVYKQTEVEGMATTTGGAIQRLDEFTIAQIRAGESIEHPAAVVKEAIENAIDAGSTSIRVEIRAGGKREIRISDNGCGIPADQIELAFERHTTSKLRQADDLFAIFTLGFRGEALASMASVAQVTCTSRTADAEVGTEVRLARGKVIARTPRGIPPGTTLIIQNLFGEVPVRLKFLKSDAAEAARVTEVVQHAALSRPEIRWTLVIDGREQLQTSGSGDVRDVMLSLYGLDVVRDLLQVDDQDGQENWRHAYRAGSVHQRRTLGTRKGIHLFVNGRPIQAASTLGAAVQDAYYNLVPSGRFPYACLSIEVDPGAIDVNIHPSKREVKLQWSERVIGLIGRAVRTALSDGAVPVPLGESLNLGKPEQPQQRAQHEHVHFTEMLDASTVETPILQPQASAASGPSHTMPQQAPFSLDEEAPSSHSAPVKPRTAPQPTLVTRRPPSLPTRAESQERVQKPTFATRRPSVTQAPPQHQTEQAEARIAEQTITQAEASPTVVQNEQESITEARAQTSENSGASVLSELRLIGQHERTWILASAPGMLYLIDQHRAHERVLYERLLRDAPHGSLPQQQMVPQEVVLQRAIADSLMHHRTDLTTLGLAIAPAATGRIVVSATPAVLEGADMQAFLHEVGATLLNANPRLAPGWREQMLATIACHGSIRPDQLLSFAEMQNLLGQLQQCEHADRCAHGFAVVSSITTTWIKQQFDSSDKP